MPKIKLCALIAFVILCAAGLIVLVFCRGSSIIIACDHMDIANPATETRKPALYFTDADSPLDVLNALRDHLIAPENQNCPVVANVAGFGTGHGAERPIGVLLYDASDEQIYLFRTIIADSPFFIFMPPPMPD